MISKIGRSIAGLTDFSGRISPLTFWILYFIPIAVCLAETQSAHMVRTRLLLSVPISFLFISGGVKRLHDRGHTGWLLGLIVIPVVGQWLLLFECCFMPGKPGTNEYGPGPAGRAARPGSGLTFDPLGWLVGWLGFDGRISRLGFWFFYLLPFLLTFHFVVRLNPFRLSNDRMLAVLIGCVWLYCAGQTKRFHDLNMTVDGRTLMLNFFPPMTLYFLARCGFQAGSAGQNRFGPAPGSRGRTQARAPSREEVAVKGRDAHKGTPDDQIGNLIKKVDSGELSDEKCLDACIYLAKLLDSKKDVTRANTYWRKANQIQKRLKTPRSL
jgi:uncharacterized membrane protein YhaH (DUF805 family)